jgi:hypothetical protein
MTSLNRDANYKSLLDKIGQIYFGMPPPPKRAQTGGLFGGAFINNLLKGVIFFCRKHKKKDIQESVFKKMFLNLLFF